MRLENKNPVYIFETWEDFKKLYFIHRHIFVQFFKDFQKYKYIEISNEELATDFNISINQVAHALKRLEELNFIWRKPVLIIEDGIPVAKSRRIFLSKRRDWSSLTGGGSSG